MTGDARTDPRVEGPFLGAQPAKVGEPTPGKVGLDAGEWSQQATDRPLVAGGGQVRRRSAIPGQQRPQVGVEAIADPGHLGHDIFTGLDEQSDFETRVSRPDRRQVQFAGGHPGDGEGVTRVALAGSARPDPFSPGELRRDLADGQPGRDEEPGEGVPRSLPSPQCR